MAIPPRSVRRNVVLIVATLGLALACIVGWQADAHWMTGVDPQAGSRITSVDILAPTAVLAVQDFESPAGTPTWPIGSGSGNISANTGAGDTPANQRIRGGSRSWQVNNGTATLDLNPFSISGATGVTVDIHLSSTSANATDGADDTDSLKVFAALNGAGFSATPEFTLTGAPTGQSNARWSFNNTINNSTSPGNPSSFNGTPGTDQGTIHSTLRINIPNGNSSVALRITAVNDNANEVWNVDDITISGTPATAAGVSISGRVLTYDGAGLRNAVVLMTDAGGRVRRALTSAFGYFTFQDVEPGSYVVGVQARRYAYSSRLINVNDQLTNIDFYPIQ